MSFKKACRHLKTVHNHRREVRKNCFRMGLYWQGLTHDLSKFSWAELRIGAKYFMEDQSPHNGERARYGYSSAWLHHKGRNKHHLEYWMDYDVYGDGHIAGMRMPEKYVAEMVADRVAASKIYKKDKYTDASALEYYMAKRDCHVLHPDTKKLLEKLLFMLAEQGEEATFRYIRREVLGKRAPSRHFFGVPGGCARLRRKTAAVRRKINKALRKLERHGMVSLHIKCIKFALIDRRKAIENIFAAPYAAGRKRVHRAHERRKRRGKECTH